MFAKNIENLKALKYNRFFKKTLRLSIVCSRWGHEYEKISKEDESTEILKIIGLIINIEEYQKIYNHVCGKHRVIT